MEKKEISDKKLQDTSCKSTSEREQTASSSKEPSYIKSHSETQMNSIKLDHTWKINQFKHICKIYREFESPFFSGKYIKVKIFPHKTDHSLRIIKFYLHCVEFYGECTTTIIYPSETILSSKSIYGTISNDTLLIELSEFNIKEFDDNCALIVRCKFEFSSIISNNILEGKKRRVSNLLWILWLVILLFGLLVTIVLVKKIEN